jgi:hypothetical protein
MKHLNYALATLLVMSGAAMASPAHEDGHSQHEATANPCMEQHADMDHSQMDAGEMSHSMPDGQHMMDKDCVPPSATPKPNYDDHHHEH